MSNSQAVPLLHRSSSHPQGLLTMPPSHLDTTFQAKQKKLMPKRIEEFEEVPALGDDGGERNVVEEPALSAE